MVHPVRGAAPDADDPTVLDRDVETVTVAVEDRRALHPPLHIGGRHAFGEVGVDPDRPWRAPPVRRSSTPRLGDAIDARHRRTPAAMLTAIIYPSSMTPIPGSRFRSAPG